MNRYLLLALALHGKVPAKGLRLRSVKLDASANDNDNPKWIQVAEQGDYRGHSSGAFELDATVFNNIVQNFHNHPSYLKDPGKARVIPFDFSHASEQNPTSGTLPLTGAPAQAWGLELEVRTDPGTGKAQLWCFTDFLEPMRTYVAEGRYQWTSVTIWPDAIEPVSGKDIGWYLSSIAFTNDPFIQGMVPIAATRGGGVKALLENDYAADTLEYVICSLRSLFGLPELATLDEVMMALMKLRQYAANPGSEPAGVDVDDLICGLKWLFNLPTLSTVDEVFAEGDRLLVALAEQASSGRMTTRTGDAPKENDVDKFEKACIALAARLKIKLTADADIGAILLDAVDKAAAGGDDATAKLTALMTALGVPDPAAGVAKIADLLKQAQMLTEAMPELAALKEQKDAAEEKSQGDDVNEAMAYHRIPDTARFALQYMRKNDPKGFAEKYPRPTQEQRALSQRLTNEVIGAPRTLSGNAAGAPVGGGGPTPTGEGVTLEALELYEGRNITEKALAYIQTTPAGKTLNWESANEAAGKLLARLRGGARKGAPNSLG